MLHYRSIRTIVWSKLSNDVILLSSFHPDLAGWNFSITRMPRGFLPGRNQVTATYVPLVTGKQNLLHVTCIS